MCMEARPIGRAGGVKRAEIQGFHWRPRTRSLICLVGREQPRPLLEVTHKTNWVGTRCPASVLCFTRSGRAAARPYHDSRSIPKTAQRQAKPGLSLFIEAQ